MPNEFFKFKQFIINQNDCAMKVGTDGVLLGAWTNCSDADQILDIGTGTGLIAIMLAQKSSANIDAIEIEQNAYLQARDNVQSCQWSERINVKHTSLKAFCEESNKRYDLIVSNPPFFSDSLKPPSEERSTARHDQQLSINELLESIDLLLSENGRFCMISPYSDVIDNINKAKSHKLYCGKLMRVKPTPVKQPKRVLYEFIRKEVNTKESELIIESDGRHKYSEDYKRITKDYYLKF